MTTIDRKTPALFAISIALASSVPVHAISQDVPKPAMSDWLRCLQGNSFSEVEKTPEHAVEIAFEKCRTQEDQAIQEQFPDSQASQQVEIIRSRVQESIKPSLVSNVVDNRASDPELHAPFASAVKEDERRRARAKVSLPLGTTTITPVATTSNCSVFRSTALAKPNQLAAFVRASANPALTTTLAGSLGPFKVDFPKDEFTSTSAYNAERQTKWLALLGGGQNLVVRKALGRYDLKYDADRGVMIIEIGSAIYDSLRRDAEGAYFQIDYKTIREKTQFKGGISESVDLELSSSAIGTVTQMGSRVIEVPMSPATARRLKESAVLAFEVSLPIAADAAALVMYHDLVKFGGEVSRRSKGINSQPSVFSSPSELRRGLRRNEVRGTNRC